MLDDFFVRALLVGIAIALMSGSIGCVIVWRRMAFFGDTLAHASLLGIALGAIFSVAPLISVFLTGALVALILVRSQKYSNLSSDTWLGILSHSALALGLILFSFMARSSAGLLSLLLGDILSVSILDLGLSWASMIIVMCVMWLIWNDLLHATLHQELALAEGARSDRANLLFALSLALVIAFAIQIVGVLLVSALLIIPAASARQGAQSPEIMVLLASIIGVVSVVTGLYGSLWFQTPSGPSIVLVAALIFVAMFFVKNIRTYWANTRET